MIEQLPVYGLLLLMGWLPLQMGYRSLELVFPFPIKAAKVNFSLLPFLYLIYIGLEIARSYFMMFVVHEWLAFDFDLIFGAFLFLLAIGFPIYIPSQYRTSLWLSMVGIYAYLFPYFFWLMPIVLITMFLFGQSRLNSYLFLGLIFLIIGVFQGGNSLYILLYIALLFYLILKTYLDSETVKSN